MLLVMRYIMLFTFPKHDFTLTLLYLISIH